MNQKFFGLAKHKNSILFLGGQKLNMNFNNSNNDNNNSENNFCFQYNYEKNLITESKNEFFSINFIEKTFIPIENNMYIQFAEYKKEGNKNAIKKVEISRKEKEFINSEIIK